MTKDKFRSLCDEILIPKLKRLIKDEMQDLQAPLDAMSDEMIRIGRQLETIGTQSGHAE
jgi:hypothetical protein